MSAIGQIVRLALALALPAVANASEAGFGVSSGGSVAAGRESYKSELATGAATLAYPLLVPPGTNGLTPELTLNYSSATGVTWLGRGWDLAFPVIRRSTRLGVPSYDDDPETGDRFALGDDDLVRDDAGSYHTERESFQAIERVDANGDGAIESWRVHQTDGRTLEFGTTAGARVHEPGGAIAEWLLSRVTDANANFIRYEYQTPEGSAGIAYPRLLAWSFRGDESPGSPTLRSVEFLLEPRPDPALSYAGGVRRLAGHRLTAVEIRRGSARVTRYELRYLDESGQAPPNQRSLLGAIERFGADGGGPLPASVFRWSGMSGPSWGQGAVASALAAQLQLLGSVQPNGYNRFSGNWAIRDLNGDAAPDILFTRDDVAAPGSSAALAFLNLRAVLDVGGSTLPFFPAASTANKPVYHPPRFTNGETAHVARRWSRWVDYTGDGRVDVLFGRRNAATGSRAMFAFANSGIDWALDSTGYASPPADLYVYRADCGVPYSQGYRAFGYALIADVNADGLVDLLEHRAPDATSCAAATDAESWTIRSVYLNHGSGFRSAPDSAWSAAWAYAIAVLGGFAFEVSPLDVNGDGLVDLARDANGDGALDGDTLVNTGRAWTPSVAAGLALPAGLRPLDLDGDGLVDHAGNPVLLNRGTAFVATAALPMLPDLYATLDAFETLEDLDGDGVLDLIRAPGNLIPPSVWLSTEGPLSEGVPAGLLVGVDHATGGTTSLDYGATTEGSCYDADSGGCHAVWATAPTSGSCFLPMVFTADPSLCAFPVETLPFRVQTVARVETDDRAGNVQRDHITYAEGVFDASEREFVGFGLVNEAPDPDLWVDPKSAALVSVAPRRETRFYQAPFLRGAIASVELFGRPSPFWPAEVRLERQVHHYAVTRGDLEGTALLQSHGYVIACDLEDLAEVEVPGGAACPDLVDLETSAYAELPLPDSLPYASFRASFGAANLDAVRAYLTLPVANATLLFDGTLGDPDPSDPVVLQSVRWHDSFGNVSADWSKGVIGDDTDDRLALTAYATPAAGAPPNLRSRPRWTLRQSVQGGAVVGASSFDYDDLPNGEVARGNLTRRLDGLGADTTRVDLEYPLAGTGLPASVTDPYRPGEQVRTTLHEYDDASTFELRRVRGALSTLRILDPPGAPPGLGLVWKSIDSNGAIETAIFDRFGRATARSGPSPIGEVEFRSYDDFHGYDPTRARVRVTSDDGQGNRVSSEVFADGLGRPIRIETSGLDAADAPATRVRTIAYDRFGSVRARSRAFLAGAPEAPGQTHRYDERGRLRYSIGADGAVEELRRTRLAETRIDAEGRETLRLRDGSGAVVLVREGDGPAAASTRYRFDALGRLRVICDPFVPESACPAPTCSTSECAVPAPSLPRHTTVIDYDSLGRKRRFSDPDQGEWRYEHDGRGEPTLQRDARGHEIAYAYDSQGRLVRETVDGTLEGVRVYGDDLAAAPASCGDLSNVAHAAGRLICVTSLEGAVTHRYDLPARLVETRFTLPGAVATYAVSASYDWLGRRVAETHPDGETVSFAYDTMGADRVSGAHAYLVDAHHDAEGALLRLRFGNGVERVIARHASTGLPALTQDVGPSGVLVDRSLEYDRTRRITSIVDGVDPAETLSAILYDDRSRLVSLARGTLPLAWTYDALGNLTSKEGRALAYQHPAKPHALWAAADPGRYQYDANGNLVLREGTALGYDARGRLTLVSGEPERRYGYAPAGGRVREERGARISHFLGPDLEIRSVRARDGSIRHGVRLVKTIRVDGMVIARVARALPNPATGP